MKRPLTPARIEEAALFRELGLSWRKIAIWYELPASTVRDRVTKHLQERFRT